MTKPASVLIVDDCEADVYLIREQLKRSGRFGTIISRADGEDALELFTNPDPVAEGHVATFPPDVIMLDINMPRMDGFEFLQNFEELRVRHEIPSVVLMVTSSHLEQDLARASRFECVRGYLIKPPTADDIQQIADALSSNAWSTMTPQSQLHADAHAR